MDYKKRIFNFLVLGICSIISAVSVLAAGSVTLSAVPTSNTVTVGQSVDYTIKINRDAFTDKVTLSATGLPTGATATFNPNTTTAATSVLTVKTLNSTPVGTFNFTVKGTTNGITIAPITLKLITKPQSSVSASVNPESQSIIAGQQTYYDIQIQRTNYDGLVSLSAENIPNGVTVKFEPSLTYGNSSRMYLYSNGLPFLSNQFSMVLRVKGIGSVVESLKTFYLVVNCGIVWADQFGTPDNSAGNPDFATDVTYDLNSMGNVLNTYVVGYTNKLGQNDYDSWVAKYDQNGNKLWQLAINYSTTHEYPKKVAVDSAGNVYVGGTYRRNLDYVNYDAFLAKIAPNGTLLNVQTMGTNYEDGTGGMAIGFNGNNVIFTVAMDIRRLGITNFDLTRFVFNSNFTTPSSTNLTNDTIGEPEDLAVAPDGSIYVVGWFDLFPPRVGFIEKFNGNGNSVWREEQSQSGFNPKRVAVDANNNAYVAIENGVSNNNYNISLRKYYSNHTGSNPPAWIFQESSTSEIFVKAIAVDNNNHVYYGGSVGNGDKNGWFRKISTVNGTSILRREFQVADKDSFNAFKANDNNELFVAGDTVNFKNVNFGFEDALVLRYATNYCLF